MLCLEDIYYADDRCICKQCKEENTDNGTGTILDQERFHSFKNIMSAYHTKSDHDKDKCPKCLRPFSMPHPWRDDDDESESDMKSMIPMNRMICNCCGRGLSNDNIQNNDLELTYNNCMICNYYYCDKCRKCCFYVVEERITIKPPTPVQNGMINFFKEQTLGGGNSQKFECCEICWYRYYCRECVHCEYKFCGKCKGKWVGCTANWSDKEKRFKDKDLDLDDDDDKEEHKYTASNLYALIDEKNGKHDCKAHHFCAEEVKRLKQQKLEEKQSKEQKYLYQLTSMQRQKNKEENAKKDAMHKLRRQKKKNIE